MRNLKKVLSLTLALVMLLGMMVVGAGAAGYKDEASITKTEAVDVMTALEIFEGSDGSFNPQKPLTRAQAAKILVFVSDGPAVANALGQSDTQFTDVAANDWFSGYVAYCANLGIVSGTTPTTFAPNKELTAEQFAKMLLVAMGSEADYTGAAFSSNVRRDAIKAKLNKDVGTFVWNQPLPREQACQMALNALVMTLDGGKVRYPVTVKDKDTMYFETLNEAVLYANIIDGATVGDPVTDTSGSLGEKNYNLKQETLVDKLGDKITKWTANGDVEVIIDKSSDALLTIAGEDYKKGEVSDKKVTAGTLKGYTEGKEFESWYNGRQITNTGADEYYAKFDSARGATIKVYGSDKTMSKVVIEEPYFTVVNSVSKKGDVIRLDVYEAGYMIGKKAYAPKTVEIKEDYGDYDLVKDMAKGDVFMGIFQPGWEQKDENRGQLVAIAGTPDSFDGKVTATRYKAGSAWDGKSYNASTVTVDGEVHKFANEYTRAEIKKVGVEGTFYTFNGYLYHFEATSESGPDGYALITEVSATLSGDLNNGGVSMQARAILSDGTVGVYSVAVDSEGKAGGVTMVEDDELKTGWQDSFKNKVFTYSIKDNELTLGGTKVGTEKGDTANITDYVGSNKNGSTLFNSKTVFVLWTGTGKNTTARMLTGVAALGTINKTSGQAVLGDNMVANIAFIKGTTSPVSSGEYVYVDTNTEGAELIEDTSVITYTGITPEGEEITVYSGKELTKNGVYGISEDNEIATSVFGPSVTNFKTGTADVLGELLQIGDDGDIYTITEETDVVAIADGADVDEFDEWTVMVVLSGTTKNVETIFITAAPDGK